MRLDELPIWLQMELCTQAKVGERNNHCIKIAPAMLRKGMSEAETVEALESLYPDARPGEVEAVVRNAVKYAEQDDEFEVDPNRAAKYRLLEERKIQAQRMLPDIIKRWPMEDIESSLPDLPLIEQRKLFIKTMFKHDDILWIGEKYSSGPKYAHCFQPAHAWLEQRFIMGEFISHSTFQPGTVSRAKEFIKERRYLVLESDTLHPADLAAVARYLRDYHEIPLRAIVTTGGVRHAPMPGFHFWFEYPGDEDIDEWGAVLQGYGADVATLRGPQPVRLPGCIRGQTQQPQQLIYLQQNI